MQDQNFSNQQAQSPQVGFPEVPSQKKKKLPLLKIVVAIFGVLIILGVGGYLVVMSNNGETIEIDSEPQVKGDLNELSTPMPAQTPEPTPTPTPSAVKKSELKISVLNGTGTPGDAGFLKDELEGLDFEDITAGNADDQTQKVTTVVFSKEVSEDVKDEIETLLNDLYEEVEIETRTVTTTFDIEITTGTRS